MILNFALTDSSKIGQANFFLKKVKDLNSKSTFNSRSSIQLDFHIKKLKRNPKKRRPSQVVFQVYFRKVVI